MNTEHPEYGLGCDHVGGLGRDPSAAQSGEALAGRDRTSVGHCEEHRRERVGLGPAPKDEREPAGSLVDEVEPRIRSLLTEFPTMPATVIAERIGWAHLSRARSDGGSHSTEG